MMTQTLAKLLFLILITVSATAHNSLTYVNWPYQVISQPQSILITNLYVQDFTMEKNSTFSLYFNIYIVADIYAWHGPQNMLLDNGEIVKGTWKYPPKGSYEKNQVIKVEWKVKTDTVKESSKLIFADQSNQIKCSFILPPFSSSNLRNDQNEGNNIEAFDEILELK